MIETADLIEVITIVAAECGPDCDCCCDGGDCPPDCC
jgi:hypothetical protein